MRDDHEAASGTTEDAEGSPMTAEEGGFPGDEAAPGMGDGSGSHPRGGRPNAEDESPDESDKD